MQLTLIIAISLHVLSAVFWAGSSFVIARMGGAGAEKLFGPQMGAAAVAVLTGGYLWHELHEGSLGPMEQFLGVGVGCALLALLVQAAVSGRAVARLRRQADAEISARSALLMANRIAALLLAIATISMAGARYA